MSYYGCVTHTHDVLDFPDMSQHQQFLVPLMTLESTEKGSSAQSVHGDKLLLCSEGRSRDEQIHKIQNTRLGISALRIAHVFLMVRMHCQIPAERHDLKHLPPQHFQLCFMCYFCVDSLL